MSLLVNGELSPPMANKPLAEVKASWTIFSQALYPHETTTKTQQFEVELWTIKTRLEVQASRTHFYHGTDSEQSFISMMWQIYSLLWSWTPSLYTQVCTQDHTSILSTRELTVNTGHISCLQQTLNSHENILPWNSSKSRCCGSMLAAWRTGCDGDHPSWGMLKFHRNGWQNAIEANESSE